MGRAGGYSFMLQGPARPPPPPARQLVTLMLISWVGKQYCQLLLPLQRHRHQRVDQRQPPPLLLQHTHTGYSGMGRWQ